MTIFCSPLPVNATVREYRSGSTEKQTLLAEMQSRCQNITNVPLLIGDQVRTSDNPVQISSPHKHAQVVAQCSHADENDLAKAVKQAVRTQKSWSKLSWEHRAAIFLKAADLLEDKYRPAINATTMLAQGKNVYQAEIDAACELIDFLRYNVAFVEEIYRQQPTSAAGIWNRSEYRGLEGFVYAISPFNFTSLAINLAAAPALMGCAVLWKPSDPAALSNWVGMQLLLEAGLPEGVINFVPGDPVQVTDYLLRQPELAGIHFTGSTQVFRQLWTKVGNNINTYRNYPRLVGETGGKDFVFAHSSADRPTLINSLIRGAFEYQGQKCSAASRAYIAASVWHDIKDKLIEETAQIKMGDPIDFANFMGAVISAPAYQRISGFLAEAKTTADVLVGGECDDTVGYYVRPTIIQTHDPKYRSMQEELFAPVLTVYVYDDDKLDETLELCDTTSPFALTGAIFASDRGVVAKMTDALRYAAGNFYINDKPTGAVVGQQPFGGSRASGTNDKAGSIWNLTRWMSARTIKDNFLPLTDYRYPHMT
ncbi:MAG: L-glutamate gamma-semialdehyde dehydrogenase [Pseudomonadota bacterium]|nr:L-glutamate gamma-semialdehyde dehydrogenase [Pseudomonadota bacterium]